MAGARPERIPNFGYVYGFTSGTYLLTDHATGKGYRGQGKYTGRRFPGEAGPVIVGNLVKNSRFYPNTVQGSLSVPFRMTLTANEAHVTDNGTERCRESRTNDIPFALFIRLSVYPAERVLGRFVLYTPLGHYGHCSPSLGDRGLAHQWFELAPFTRQHFALELKGSGIVEDRAGNRHSLKWSITIRLVRVRSLIR